VLKEGIECIGCSKCMEACSTKAISVMSMGLRIMKRNEQETQNRVPGHEK
jgi:ferredoxin